MVFSYQSSEREWRITKSVFFALATLLLQKPSGSLPISYKFIRVTCDEPMQSSCHSEEFLQAERIGSVGL